jgi:hypothetical protein
MGKWQEKKQKKYNKGAIQVTLGSKSRKGTFVVVGCNAIRLRPPRLLSQKGD